MNRTGLPKGYVGVYEFARETKLSIEHIYRLIYQNKISGAKKFGRKWGIPQGVMRERVEQMVVNG